MSFPAGVCMIGIVKSDISFFMKRFDVPSEVSLHILHKQK